jgi:hypothetical protein
VSNPGEGFEEMLMGGGTPPEPATPARKNMVGVHHDKHDPTMLHVTFGAGTRASELAEKLAELAPDAMLMFMDVSYYCDTEGCEGEPQSSDCHHHFVAMMSVDVTEPVVVPDDIREIEQP